MGEGRGGAVAWCVAAASGCAVGGGVGVVGVAWLRQSFCGGRCTPACGAPYTAADGGLGSLALEAFVLPLPVLEDLEEDAAFLVESCVLDLHALHALLDAVGLLVDDVLHGKLLLLHFFAEFVAFGAHLAPGFVHSLLGGGVGR